MLTINKNLIQRTLAGALLVGGIVAAILWNIWSYALAFIFISVCAVREFHKLTDRNADSFTSWLSAISAAILFLTLLLHESQVLPPLYTHIAWAIYGLCIMTFIVSELFRRRPDTLADWEGMALAQIYIAVPFALLNEVIFFHGAHHPMLLLALFVTIWCNDTFAYLFGSLFGRHQMAPRISPKKTWEGFIGGAAGALLSGYIFSISDPELTLLQWFIFSEIVVIFGTLGDLVESLLKRHLGVKDSGHAIPGHGGWLDRFDSMLLAAPAVTLYLYLI